MNCEKCKDRDECVFYQRWLNTRDYCCPYVTKKTKDSIKVGDDLNHPSSTGTGGCRWGNPFNIYTL